MNNVKISIVPDTIQRLQMSDEQYFGNGLPEYISNSKLGLINPVQGGSARKYSFGFEDEAKYSAALELGSAVHALILESEKYQLSEVTKPSGMVGPIFDTVYKLMHQEKKDEPMSFDEALNLSVAYHNYYNGKVEGKRRQTLVETGTKYLEFLTEYKTPGVICLPDDMRIKLLACVESINKSKSAKQLLNPPSDEFFPILSFNEDVFICDIEVETGDEYGFSDAVKLSLKAKMDNWSVDEDNKVLTLNDLKTTGKNIQDFPGKLQIDYVKDDGKLIKVRNFVKGSFQTYHYHRQMYMYSWMLWEYAKVMYNVDDSWTLNVNMIVVETNKPHNSQVFKVSQNWLDLGEEEFKQLIGRVVWHNRHGYDKLMEFDRDLIYVIE